MQEVSARGQLANAGADAGARNRRRAGEIRKRLAICVLDGGAERSRVEGVREQRLDLLEGLGLRKLFDDVLQVGERLQPVGLGRLDQAVDVRARLSSAHRVGK